MGKKLFFILLCIAAIGLTACSRPALPQVECSTAPQTQQTTAPEETVCETVPETVMEEETTVPYVPEHSPLYVDGLCVEDVILYFNEVVLDAEVVNGGDATLLQKWTVPIYYQIFGKPTAEDLKILSGFATWLNSIEGFPGIYESQDPMNANLSIHFCSYEDLLMLMGGNFAGTDGAVTFWYSDNRIYDAIICCRCDINQYLRNSVIQEELYNGLGPVQDTSLRPDSMIYSGFSEPQMLTEIDELILRLLYHPDLLCGMNAEECEAVIRKLYY